MAVLMQELVLVADRGELIIIVSDARFQLKLRVHRFQVVEFMLEGTEPLVVPVLRPNDVDSLGPVFAHFGLTLPLLCFHRHHVCGIKFSQTTHSANFLHIE